MKRTCAYCRAIYDDGLPYPPNCSGDFKDPKKNHGTGPCCVVRANAEVDEAIKELKEKR